MKLDWITIVAILAVGLSLFAIFTEIILYGGTP